MYNAITTQCDLMCIIMYLCTVCAANYARGNNNNTIICYLGNHIHYNALVYIEIT